MHARSPLFLVLLCLSSAPQVVGQTPTITTVAGNGTLGHSGDGGPATLAQINYPLNLAVTAAGDFFFGDYDNTPIRGVNHLTGTITTVVGGGSIPPPNDGELATDIMLSGYGVVAADGWGNLYFSDSGSASGHVEVIRRVDAVTGRVSTIAGGGTPEIVVVPTGLQNPPYIDVPTWSGDGGPASAACLMEVEDIAVDAAGNVYFTDFCVVRRIDATTGVITRVAGNGALTNPEYGSGISIRGVPSGEGGPALAAGFSYLPGLAVDGAGNVYVSECSFGFYPGSSVHRIDGSTGLVTTVAGTASASGYTGDNGPAVAATLDAPVGLALDAAGNLFIADYGNAAIRRIDATTGIITTIAGDGTSGYSGDGGPAALARLTGPWDMAFDGHGNLYFTDSDGSRVRRIDGLAPNAAPTAIAGPDQSIHANGIVQLDGSASFDDDTPSASLLFLWTLVQTPSGSGAYLSDVTAVDPTFVADLPGTYVVELVVEDEAGAVSEPDQVVISSTNLAPTADAGADQGGVVGQLVQLDGSLSSDPEGDPLTWFWAFAAVPTGSSAVLVGSFTASPSFVPDLEGTYVVGLVVDDGFGPSLVDNMSVVVITGQQFAESATVAALNITASLSPSSVTSSGNQQALVNFLSQAVQALQGGNDPAARRKLELAIQRTDGWFLRGAPDPAGGDRDWITEHDASIGLYQQIAAALSVLP